LTEAQAPLPILTPEERRAEIEAAPAPVTEQAAPEPTEIETDPARIQKIKNSIQEGNLTLRTGKFNGKKLSPEKLASVQRSVTSSLAKLGVTTAEQATPTPIAPAEAPAPEVAPIQRDVTKPEQMTPEEFTAKSTQEIKAVGTERDKLFILAKKEYEDKRSSLTKKNNAALKRISRLNPNGGNVGIGTSSPDTYGFFVVNSTNASSGVSTVIRNFTDTGGDNTRYAGVDFMIGSDNGTASIRAYRTNSAVDYQTALTFWTKGSGAGATSPTERMRITATGNVGIGTTSPAAQLQVSTTSTSQPAAYIEQNSAFNGLAVTSSGNAGTYYIANFRSTGVDRMRILDNGDLLIGTTSTSGVSTGTSTNVGVVIEGANGAITSQRNNNASIFLSKASGFTDGSLIKFFTQGINRGSISTDGVNTAYNTSSDYRLKEDLKEIKGLEKISAIKVYDFKWKNEELRTDGVLAHELAEVLPYAVTGIKDGEDTQGVDYSKIVPVLVKAVQEQQVQIEELKTLLKAK